MIRPSRAIAGILGLAAFAVAVASGLKAENHASDVLSAALAAALVCQFVGVLIGMIMERTLEARTARHIAAHPIPVRLDDQTAEIASPAPIAPVASVSAAS